MPKMLPLRCSPDSIREFRAAAQERYRDGRVLVDAERPLAAVYLWGYAAEMTVKAAYFAALGKPDDGAIELLDLRQAKASAGGYGFQWAGNFHRVDLWGQLLVGFRTATPGFQYPTTAFGDQVAHQTQEIHRVWRETLRYHRNRPYPFEVALLRSAVEWLLDHATEL